MTDNYTELGKILRQMASGILPDHIVPELGALGRDVSAVNSYIKLCLVEIEQLRTDLARETATSRCLLDSEHLYKEVFAKAVVGIMIVTESGKILDANNAMESMLGYRTDELLNFNLAEISLPEDQNADEEFIRDLIEGRRTYYNVEKRYVRNDGILLWGLLSAFAVKNEAGEYSIINMLEDISARKSAELHLQHVSTHDSLTGLYNRAYFDVEFNRLQFGMSMPVSIVVIDVNGLKLINDTKGHEAGDYLIIGVAKVLKEAFRGDDIVARVGGDEFTVLLPETSESEAIVVMERVRKCQDRFNSSGPKYKVDFSAGVATAVKGSDIQATLKKADELMYADKVMRKAAMKEAAEKQEQMS